MRLGRTLRTEFNVDIINYFIDMGALEVPPEARVASGGTSRAPISMK